MSITYQGADRFGANLNGQARTYRRSLRFFATASPSTDGELQVYAACAALGVYLGARHPVDAYAICQSIEPSCQERRDVPGTPIWEWIAEVEWATNAAAGNEEAGGGGGDPTLPPWLRPARIRIGSAAYKRPAIKSITNQPIVNAAGDPIVIEKDRATLEITINKTLTFFSYLWAQEVPHGFRYSRNANPFVPTGAYGHLLGTAPIPVGKARCENLTATISGDGLVDAEMVVQLDEDDHASIFNQLGNFYLPVAGAPAAQKRRFMDGSGFATEPRPLNADGTARATNLEPVTGSFQLYGLEDWDLIGMLP